MFKALKNGCYYELKKGSQMRYKTDRIKSNLTYVWRGL